MGREIKCEVWDSVNKKMLSWNDIGWMEGDPRFSIHSLLSSQYAHLTPRFYTGLKDKNGKEIYEGDIDGSDEPMYVAFENGSFGLKFKDKPNYFDNCINWDMCEIIGNIYEHPHLLKGDEEHAQTT